MSALRKNIAGQVLTFQLNAKADGTPVTAGGAGTITIDNAAQTALTGTFTHKGTGQWSYLPTQAETNGNSIGFQFTGTGAVNVNLHCFTTAGNPSDGVAGGLTALPTAAMTGTGGFTFTGASKLDVSVRDWVGDTIPARSVTGVPKVDVQDLLGTLVATPAVAGIFDVNVKNINNVAATAVTTIKAVQGLTTADTIATYTGNTPQTGDSFATLTGVNTELTAVPASTATLVAMVKWLFVLARNKITQSATTTTVRNDADALTISTSTVSDDATTFTRSKFT